METFNDNERNSFDNTNKLDIGSLGSGKKTMKSDKKDNYISKNYNIILGNLLTEDAKSSNSDNISSQRSSSSESGTNKHLMMICGQNGSPMEFFSQNDRLIQFYLSHGTDVLIWNYRGYGFSTGTCDLNVRD